MKKFILSMFLLMQAVAVSAADDATQVPSYLKDAEITVRLKNGKEYKYSANTHAVVTRASSNKKKPAEVIVREKVVIKERIVEVAKPTKNRVRLVGGRGPDGLDTDRKSDSVEISTRKGNVGGIGYDRLLDDKISVGAQIMSNGTSTLGLGLDF
jgi:hypothetical protein